MGGSRLRRAPGSLSREANARRSEERCGPWSRVARRPTLRRAPRAAPRWPGPCLEAGRRSRAGRRASEEVDLPAARGTGRRTPEEAVLPAPPRPTREAPKSSARLPVVVLPVRAGDGCARKRSRCDDAPIRRSEPPHHRSRFRAGHRSFRPLHVKPPGRYPRRSTDAAAGGRTSPTADMAIEAAPEQALTRVRRPRLRFPDRSRRVPSRCARTHRGGPASESVEISRSSRLQGVAPLTSPS
jgi:hypothetical protein